MTIATLDPNAVPVEKPFPAHTPPEIEVTLLHRAEDVNAEVRAIFFARQSGLRSRDFWRRQFIHQAPMIGAMALMSTVLRSTPGLLAIVAGLWLVALVRARAARTSVPAREFLVDILAMAVVLLVPLIHGDHSATTMPGMASASLGGRAGASIVLLAWAGVRFALIRLPRLWDRRAGSVVSAICCGLGLVAMLII